MLINKCVVVCKSWRDNINWERKWELEGSLTHPLTSTIILYTITQQQSWRHSQKHCRPFLLAKHYLQLLMQIMYIEAMYIEVDDFSHVITIQPFDNFDRGIHTFQCAFTSCTRLAWYVHSFSFRWGTVRPAAMAMAGGGNSRLWLNWSYCRQHIAINPQRFCHDLNTRPLEY